MPLHCVTQCNKKGMTDVFINVLDVDVCSTILGITFPTNTLHLQLHEWAYLFHNIRHYFSNKSFHSQIRYIISFHWINSIMMT